MVVRCFDRDSIVVDPLDVAWLTGEGFRLREARGCVCFDAKGESDVTVILKAQPGSKRIMEHEANAYTIIIGSHGNRHLKIERNGNVAEQLTKPKLAEGSSWQRFWVDIQGGRISVGTGDPDDGDVLTQWQDPSPISSVEHVGLSTWDTHVSYRNIELVDPVDWAAAEERKRRRTEELARMEGQKHPSGNSIASVERFFNSPTLADLHLQPLPDQAPLPLDKAIELAATHGVRHNGGDDSGSGFFAHAALLGAACPTLLPSLTVLERSRRQETNEGLRSADAVVSVVPLPGLAASEVSAFLEAVYVPGRTCADASPLLPSPERAPLDGTSSLLLSGCVLEDIELETEADEDEEEEEDDEEEIEEVMEGMSESESEGGEEDAMMEEVRQRSRDDSTALATVERFVAHRIVLVACSAFFEACLSHGFRESAQRRVTFPGVRPSTLRSLLAWLYRRELPTTHKHVLSLLFFAEKLQVTPLVEECSRVIARCFTPFNVIGTMVLCEQMGSSHSANLEAVRCAGVEYAARQLPMLWSHARTDILRAPFWLVSAVVTSPALRILREDDLFDILEAWMRESGSTSFTAEEEGLCALETLLPHVRFPLFARAVLTRIETEPLAQRSSVLRSLLHEAQALHSGEQRLQVESERLVRRMGAGAPAPHQQSHQQLLIGGGGGAGEGCSTTSAAALRRLRVRRRETVFRELAYTSPGDRNGVCYFAGTAYGSSSWTNPVLSRRLSVTASSPASRHTDPKVMVSRQFMQTSFAGPARAGSDGTTAWWQVTLEEPYRLICNTYTMQQDGSSNFPRSWVLQGRSFEGAPWETLREHVGDATLSRPAQYAAFGVDAAESAYRSFRLGLTGPTADPARPFCLCICAFELYGWLTVADL